MSLINPTVESKIIQDDANALATFKRLMNDIYNECEFSTGGQKCTNVTVEEGSLCEYHTEGNRRLCGGICLYAPKKVFICNNPIVGEKGKPFCINHIIGVRPSIRKRLGKKVSRKRQCLQHIDHSDDSVSPSQSNQIVMLNKRLDAHWQLIEKQNEIIDTLVESLEQKTI